MSNNFPLLTLFFVGHVVQYSHFEWINHRKTLPVVNSRMGLLDYVLISHQLILFGGARGCCRLKNSIINIAPPQSGQVNDVGGVSSV